MPLSKSIPNWDQLCRFNQQDFPSRSIAKDILYLKKRRPSVLIYFARLMVHTVFRDPSYQKFLTSSWGEIVDLIHDQAVRNQEIVEHQPDSATPWQNSIKRSYNQLPCTEETRAKRVAWIQSFCTRDEAILLAGDDDRVGPALCRAGFTDVTSIDIDPLICQSLKEECSAEALKLKVFVHDLSTKNPGPQAIHDYKLILVDPMYSLEGVRFFVEGARKLCTHPDRARFVLCVHLLSLMKNGLQQLDNLLGEMDLEVEQLKESFNAYPIPVTLNRAIRLFNWKFMKTPLMKQERYRFPYFLSDALLLKPRGTHDRT